MIHIPPDRVTSSETPYRPIELTSRLALKVAKSPLQRLRWLRCIAMSRLTVTESHVAIILAEMAGNGKSWPSLKTLGKEMGKARATVARATATLEALGYLQKTSRFNSSTVYLLTFPTASE